MSVFFDIYEAQIPKLLEIIREQRIEIKALKARLELAELHRQPPAPEQVARGLALLKFRTRGQ
jgi:hypothetical protein